jgi:secreted protein with Ig-like and vWFA domain
VRYLVSLLLLASLCSAQTLPSQHDLDLPVDPSTYKLGATPVPTPPADDPKDEPAPIFYGEEIPTESSSLIYVLDFSGSMKYQKRIETLKDEFEKSVRGLSPTFEINVVTYGCWTKRWSSGMKQATDANKAAAIAWVRSQEPQGGTATGPAVALGLQDKTNLAVVLLTDGDPNCGADDREGHRQMIRRANSQGATINVFGIAAKGDYRQFCQNVASDSNGNYYDVANSYGR